ncbi:hypothetical protein SKAU_G00168920 [Synaphobranchus kaupii]|uniref:Uncharacterized protein n=1 Tax=Synaphobranchus kaupii TaxID=118154 RepID=A0A9Q1FJZ7_SYNKA|nr:hypothetical protein SKAU_G00168920 [Synaphobranchus kaupii]
MAPLANMDSAQRLQASVWIWAAFQSKPASANGTPLAKLSLGTGVIWWDHVTIPLSLPQGSYLWKIFNSGGQESKRRRLFRPV